jgi:NADH-quinone oxidoreductase subunit C
VQEADARALVQQQFSIEPEGPAGNMMVNVPRDRWAEFGAFARTTMGCGFFSFLTVVDWKTEGLQVVARVENLDVPFAVTMKTSLMTEENTCPSLFALYRGADWMEREAFDMFGVVFQGHPDLRRILLPDDWNGHPLLKSYAVDTPYPPYR